MVRFSTSSLAAAIVLVAAVAGAPEAATPSSPAPAAAADPAITRLIDTLGLVESPQPVRERRGWQPPRRIVVRRLGPDTAARLQSVAPGVAIDVVDTPAQALAALPGADALLGFCEAPLVAAGTRLAWVQAYFAGVDQCGTAVIAERGLLFTNMQRLAGPPMAEHVMALLLALARQLPAFLAAEREGRWAARSGEAGPMRTLEGKTLLVYGLGGIGTEVAKRAQGLGMRVTAIRASGHSGPDTVSYVGLPDELPRLAAEADVVVNCAPLTAVTRGVFDAKFFAGMKPSAYFINVGRGGSVVTADLVAALDTGKIAGAGLDVTDPEPLPPEHPLWHARNVLITPHVSSATDEAPEARFLIVRENLRRYVGGERMLSVVDAGRGY